MRGCFLRKVRRGMGYYAVRIVMMTDLVTINLFKAFSTTHRYSGFQKGLKIIKSEKKQVALISEDGRRGIFPGAEAAFR